MLVQISEAANVDLDAILDYGVAAFGEALAEAYIERFDRAYILIGDHPFSGILHERIRPPIRSLPCGSHRVYYDVFDDRAVVRRILHKSMDVERHL